MRTLSFLLLRTTLPLSALRRTLPHHRRALHAESPPPQPSPQILLHPNPNPNPKSQHQPSSEEEEDAAAKSEFLSRFVHSIHPILSSAYPSLPRQTLDTMLVLICRRLAPEIDHSSPSPIADDIELSEDLWNTIHEVSQSVHDAMRRDRFRADLKKYLHSDSVKEMCRFAGDVGVRGDMMRELRFKWAREKLEEVEFYHELEKIRESTTKEGEVKKKDVTLEALPERKGKIKYMIYGLDLSDEKWREVAGREAEAEQRIVPVEAKPVVGRCKRVEEKVYGLNWKLDDPMPVLKEWAEALGAKRVDWLGLLERIKEKNVELYFKIS